MAVTTWPSRVKAAASEAELIEVVMDFVATLEHSEWAQLPEHLRPGRFFTAEDITSYAFAIAQFERSRVGTGENFLARLASFFSLASAQASQVLAQAGPA